ncbi:DNA-binding MarR family transcriptional regulator [Aeromicrobium panaciterrae]|uniref:DNA-binding MarR family transcriptional regulator n=1 Tax=Aeromicrobium panaciterrae TaxID=363861 RepID=A0ABU1UKU1_9ACTN|nr:MarR family transcriptional regulator [Aeromicrobium panaciterrae]MDR7085786.1 DNA-binding MarR family transcriptional regulator [Aeromicrobium panaciterrae]
MFKQESLERIEREVLTIVARVRRMTLESAHRIDPQLSVPAYSVLFLIWQCGSMRAQAVSTITGADKGTVSRQIAHLESLGLVSRRPDASDGRAQILRLTAEGKARVDALVQDRRSDFTERLADWSPKDLEVFVGYLNQFNASLDA